MPYKFLLLKKLSILQTTIFCAVLGIVIFFGVKLSFENKISAQESNGNASDTRLKMLRNMNGYKYSRPLIAVDMGMPSASLEPLKEEVANLIKNGCSSGQLYQASLYLRDLESGEWASVNEDLTYHPGSLIKVPMLIYYLKLSEKDPSILDHKLILNTKIAGLPAQTFSAYSIEDNKPYTIRELLKFMASYSDNKATYLLNTNADVPAFQKVFSDLGLEVPDIHDTSYAITVKTYSLFLRVLYNATYLNPENSDFALSLLTQSSFTQGLSKGLPADMVIARKFGEMKTADKRELHESGIVYCNKRPYLVTVMTKGYNPQNQASIISQISNMIFKYFCS